MDIYAILSSKPHDETYLKRYYNFIMRQTRKKVKKNLNYERHHICPKSRDMFPEFKNFKKHQWNKVVLTLKAHCYAHYLLMMAYGNKSCTYSYCMMTGRLKNKGLSFLLSEYQKRVKIRNANVSNLLSGKVSCANLKTGETLQVEKETFDNDDELVGVNKFKIEGDKNPSKRKEVREKISEKKKGFKNYKNLKTGKINQFRTDPGADYRLVCGYSGRSNIVVLLKSGKRVSLNAEDPILETNEYKTNNANKVFRVETKTENFLIYNKRYLKNFLKSFSEFREDEEFRSFLEGRRNLLRFEEVKVSSELFFEFE